MSLKSHALHLISIITVLSCIYMCANWLCAGRIGLDWTHDAIYFGCHMFMHFPCIHTLFNILVMFELLWDFSDCLSFLPLFLFTLVVSMTPKHKSIPSQNPLHSGTSSSSSDPTHSHIRFHDESAWKDFSKNFSRRGVHSKCRVILADFTDTDLPTVIHSRGWKSLCDIPITCPTMLIQEFYSNMHGLDFSIPLFYTGVRGTHIVVTLQLVADVLHVPRVEHPD